MDIHQNARTAPASGAELVARVLDDQLPVSLVAAIIADSAHQIATRWRRCSNREAGG